MIKFCPFSFFQIIKKRYKLVFIGVSVFLFFVCAMIRFYLLSVLSIKNIEMLCLQRLNADVQISAIQSGWNWIWPSFYAKNVQCVSHIEKKTLLNISEIYFVFSWSTLLYKKPIFRSIIINNAQISVHNENGKLNIGGIKINTSSNQDNRWLLKQGKIQLRNLKVIYFDKSYSHSPYIFHINECTAKNNFLYHKINIKCLSSLSTDQIQLNAKFKHEFLKNTNDFSNWTGQFDWSINNINLKKYNNTQLQFKIFEGKISSVGKLYIQNGVISVKGILEVDRLNIFFHKSNKNLKLSYIRADIDQYFNKQYMKLVLSKIQWKAKDYSSIKKISNLSIDRIVDNISDTKKLKLKIKEINISVLQEMLDQFSFPIVQKYTEGKNFISGKIRNIETNLELAKSYSFYEIFFNENFRYKVDCQFNAENIQISNKKKDFIRFNTFSPKDYKKLNLESIKLNHHKSKYDFYLESITSDFSLEKKNQFLEIKIKKFILNNKDIKIDLFGKCIFFKKNSKKDHLSLNIDIHQAKILSIIHYFPSNFLINIQKYMNNNITSGNIFLGKIIINGNLKNIFLNRKYSDGFFLELPIYNTNWHPISQYPDLQIASAIIKIHHGNFEITSDSIYYKKTKITGAQVNIENIFRKNKILTATFHGTGPTQNILDYFSRSFENIKNLKINANGKSKFAFRIKVPISEIDQINISGKIFFEKNEILINNKLSIKNIYGDISFSDKEINSNNLCFDALGGSFFITSSILQASNEKKYNHIYGFVKVKELEHDLLNFFSIQEKKIQEHLDEYIQFNGLLHLAFRSYDLNLFFDFQKLESKLIESIIKQKEEKNIIDIFPIYKEKASDLLKNFEKDFKKSTITLIKDRRKWNINLRSKLVNGLIQLELDKKKFPFGKLIAKLKVLELDPINLGLINQILQYSNLNKKTSKQHKIPDLDILIDTLSFQGKIYKNVRFLVHHNKNNLIFDKIYFETTSVEFQGSGVLSLSKNHNTDLRFDINIQNAEEFFKYLNIMDTIKGGTGKLTGIISLSDISKGFDLNKLHGEIYLKLRDGILLKINPGLIFHLFELLNSKNFTHLIKLDIQKILLPFSENGLSFKELVTLVYLQNDLIDIKKIHIKNTQGDMYLQGKLNILNNTQNIHINIIPKINIGMVSILFIPINPVIGITSFLVQHIFLDELSSLLQFKKHNVQSDFLKFELIHSH